MKTIRFSGRYKKMLPNRHIFTTVRRWTEEKEKYYKDLVGQELRIGKSQYKFTGLARSKLLVLLFERNRLGHAVLLQVFVTHYDELSKTFIKYDTEEV